MLNIAEQISVGGLRVRGQEQPQDGVQLVYFAVSPNAKMVLGNAGAVAERGFAGVAALRVNAGEVDHADSVYRFVSALVPGSVRAVRVTDANRFARNNTASIIGWVSLPVNVFCWLG